MKYFNCSRLLLSVSGISNLQTICNTFKHASNLNIKKMEDFQHFHLISFDAACCGFCLPFYFTTLILLRYWLTRINIQKQVSHSDVLECSEGLPYWVRFQVLLAASMKMTAFWVIAPCSLLEVDQGFRGAYCLCLQPDEAVCTSKTYIPECCNPLSYCLTWEHTIIQSWKIVA
jgi:hypothetical protein